MKNKPTEITRRTALQLLGGVGAALTFFPAIGFGAASRAVTKPIPSSGERIPVIGMGTWRTFNVGTDRKLMDACVDVMKAFFAEGGGMVDSSPMYGSAQAVLGYGFQQMGGVPNSLFSADKIWTPDGGSTRAQAAEIAELWGVEKLDLLQIHNLVGWELHLETLRKMKDAGDVRYIGITTSHGRRHEDVERVMKLGGIDFVQLTYNITHQEVERRLLPSAADLGIAVIANRPFDGGDLIQKLKRGAVLPEWAVEIGCRTWADFLLKWSVSHPAVTCTIPATSRVAHLRENMQAAHGVMPDAEMRVRMAQYVQSL